MSDKIETLTSDQEALIPVWREQFRAEALRTDSINKDWAKQSVISLYESVGLNAPRFVLFAQSPWQGQMMRAFLKLSEKDQLGGQLGDQLRNQLGGQLVDQLWGQLVDQLWGQLGDQLRDQVKDYDGIWFAGAWDGYWLSYYKFANNIGVRLTKMQQTWLDAYLKYSRQCGVSFLYPNVAIICDRPSKISFDEDRRLHSEIGAALEWRDGYTLCAWHGIRIPDEWILSPDKVAPEEVLRVENTEQRAAGISIFGMAKMLDKLRHEIIDSDPNPAHGELLKVWLDGLSEPGIYLKAECPRNGIIAEAVPPICDITNKPIETVLHAQAWRVGLSPSEFRYPTLRT